MVNTTSRKSKRNERNKLAKDLGIKAKACEVCLKIGCRSCPAPRKGRKHIAVDMYTYDELNKLRTDYAVTRRGALLPMSQFLNHLAFELNNGRYMCCSGEHPLKIDISQCPHH